MAVSANGTYGVGRGASVTDANGTVYAINNRSQVTVNGKADPAIPRVDGLGYAYGRVWLKNDDNHWFSKTSATGQWVGYPAEYGVPMAPPVWRDGSALYPLYPSPDTRLRLDGKGNTWTVAAGQVVVDGRIDNKTAQVAQIEVVNGVTWKMTADGGWSGKARPSDAWSPATRVDPRLAAQAAAETWIGGPGGAMQGQNWSGGRAPAPHQTLTMHSGTMNLGSHDLAGNNLVINAAEPGARSLINMQAGGSLRLTLSDSQPGGSVTVAVRNGLAALDINGALDPEPANIAITADKASSVALHANISGGKLTETGGTVLLHGDSSFSNTTVLLNSDLLGSGAMVFQPTGGGNRLEVAGAVGAGVTIDMHGGTGLRQGPGVVVLDHAACDRGTVMLQYAMLELKNLRDVDSASYRDFMLSLYHGSSVVASVRVSAAPNSGDGRNDGTLHVGKDAAGTVYAATFASNQTPFTPLVTPGTPLPMHA